MNISLSQIFIKDPEKYANFLRNVLPYGISWTREQAIDYMLKYTSSPRYEIEIEIDRYITWPGQACAYKIGELKFRELRETARSELGKIRLHIWSCLNSTTNCTNFYVPKFLFFTIFNDIVRLVEFYKKKVHANECFTERNTNTMPSRQAKKLLL